MHYLEINKFTTRLILEVKQYLYFKNYNLCDESFGVVKSAEFKFHIAEKAR